MKLHSSLKMALTILLQLNRDDARLFPTEGLGEHQFFSLICMHCNKKVGAISSPLQKILRVPLEGREEEGKYRAEEGKGERERPEREGRAPMTLWHGAPQCLNPALGICSLYHNSVNTTQECPRIWRHH